jgi:hypothetical protein
VAAAVAVAATAFELFEAFGKNGSRKFLSIVKVDFGAATAASPLGAATSTFSFAAFAPLGAAFDSAAGYVIAKLNAAATDSQFQDRTVQ